MNSNFFTFTFLQRRLEYDIIILAILCPRPKFNEHYARYDYDVTVRRKKKRLLRQELSLL